MADPNEHKVICILCRGQLSNLDTGKLTLEKWEQDRPNVEFLLTIEENLCSTQSTLRCNSENLCNICKDLCIFPQ